jgi:hypothetical protein
VKRRILPALAAFWGLFGFSNFHLALADWLAPLTKAAASEDFKCAGHDCACASESDCNSDCCCAPQHGPASSNVSRLSMAKCAGTLPDGTGHDAPTVIAFLFCPTLWTPTVRKTLSPAIQESLDIPVAASRLRKIPI